jgi:hypothetical protein
LVRGAWPWLRAILPVEELLQAARHGFGEGIVLVPVDELLTGLLIAVLAAMFKDFSNADGRRRGMNVLTMSISRPFMDATPAVRERHTVHTGHRAQGPGVITCVCQEAVYEVAAIACPASVHGIIHPQRGVVSDQARLRRASDTVLTP